LFAETRNQRNFVAQLINQYSF